MTVKELSGGLNARGMRFALVLGRFNDYMGERLLAGAVDTLVRHGADPGGITVVRVPGAYEIPLALKALAEAKQFDALIALGVVIRGETPHFEYVAGGCVNGMGRVMMDYGLPVAFGVLTVEDMDQAIARAGSKGGNKGVDAALSAIEMVDLLKQLRG